MFFKRHVAAGLWLELVQVTVRTKGTSARREMKPRMFETQASLFDRPFSAHRFTAGASLAEDFNFVGSSPSPTTPQPLEKKRGKGVLGSFYIAINSLATLPT